ncbi:acyl carrier protein [Actinomadura soli]|uniref:Acyl carrier protein n=1 Tax=Actinomadura soli TaxID=2508997 RepID=A0A5C4J3Z1_9ACTN|nr:acyl carrier protein [Actinomadura soli]TMQ91575.1 acyl carrier protein [Actinomadura soli]
MPDRPFELHDLRRILRESAGIDESADLGGETLDTEFDALGIDSVALMETASRISREHGVQLDDEELTTSTTARRLMEMVNERRR